jgi:hypothetical protein
MTSLIRRAFSPYPEIAHPDPDKGYRIVDTNDKSNRAAEGATDKDGRVMTVPLDAEGMNISRHEMGHAKWSPVIRPDIPDKVENWCMEAVEEARINFGLRRIELPFIQPNKYARDMMESQLRAMLECNYADAVIRAVALQGSSLQQEVSVLTARFVKQQDEDAIWLQKMLKKFRRRMTAARIRSRQTVPSFQQGRKISKWLYDELMKRCEENDENPEDNVKKGGKDQQQGDQGPTSGGGAGWFPSMINMPSLDTLKKHYRSERLSESSKGERDWLPKDSMFFSRQWKKAVPGQMHIHKPELTIPLVQPELERVTKARAADEGTELRHIERYVSDQRVFRRRAKKRKGGGTVLLDVSSTMDLTDKEVMKIVEGAPEATKVATYCGNSQSGRLSIVVDKGRRASPKDVAARFGEGNNVDLHALDWLSCQPAPRVWFTDGGVTGQGHATDKPYRDLCGAIVAENGIIQCATVLDVCRALRRELEHRAGDFNRRDVDQEDYDYCHEHEGFDCKCSAARLKELMG